MSALVIDASMALSWLLPDETGDASLGVRNQLPLADSVWVAAHWRLEVCNALWMAERRRRLDAAGVAQAVALLAHLPVRVDPETDQHAGGETLGLSRQFGLSVYDAAYLELALRRGGTLASLDEPLRAAAAKLKVPMLPRRIP